MSWQAWTAVGVTVACLATLVATRVGADLVFTFALTLLLLLGVLDPPQALSGFANPGVVTIAALYIVAAGLRQTGALGLVVDRLFGRPSSRAEGQLRVMLPVTAMSAFLNNTPVVATFLPAVIDWARKHGFSASHFMIPLSYAAILGGTCTLIGTSTNLVVAGLLVEHGKSSFGFFDLAWIGVPCALLGIAYVLVATRWLLPERVPALERLNDPREYTVEMVVAPGSPIDGATVQAAGLRHLPGLYLIEIERDGELRAAIGPDELLRGGDRLVFAGITESVVDLQKIKGLSPATGQVFKLESARSSRTLIEAVLAATSPAVGKTVKASGFRNHYRAVVIAVARDGQRIRRKIGDIELRPGDTLLLEADPDFVPRYRHSRDFLLLKPLGTGVLPRHERAGVAWIVLAGVILAAGTGLLDVLTASLVGAAAMLLTRCLSAPQARRSIELEVLVVIACSFGVGRALAVTGAAEVIATKLLAFAGSDPFVALASVYLITVLFTEVITNNAAAVLVFPLAYATAQQLGLDFMPFAVAITFAASASFATPIGYQTNLMVYGPGGYKFTDFLRFGLPLNLLLAVTALTIIPRVWPLQPAG